MLALAGVAWLLGRRGRSEERTFYDLGAPDEHLAAEPAPARAAPARPVAPQPGLAAAPAPRAAIELAVHPRRAGLNLLSATAEVEVELVNAGALPAQDIAVDVRLLGARAGHDELLASHFAEPIARPVTARFALLPGEQRSVRAVAALPRDAMEPLVAGGRPMFVPVVAVNVLYGWEAEGRGQSAAAWVVGIAREGTDKLAPFWLDVQPRMHEELGAREHGLAVRQ